MADIVCIDRHEFEGHRITTKAGNILLIKGAQGFLGCGYFRVDTANKINEAVAIVRGVKSYADMLEATVTEVSDSAAQLGITIGCTGKAALLKLL